MASLAGLALAAAFAITSGWTLPEFCWSVWLAGLLFAWGCVVTGSVQIIVTARSRKPSYDTLFPFLQRIPPTAFLAGIVALVVPVAVIAFYVYGFVFTLYGLLLSFFAEMEPHSLFGRNGFINADFFTAVTYLTLHVWPMAVGALIARGDDLFRNDPWKRMLLPTRTEVLHVHVLVVVMPFLALLAWALLGEAYHAVVIVALMGVFYLLPARPATQRAAQPATGRQLDVA